MTFDLMMEAPTSYVRVPLALKNEVIESFLLEVHHGHASLHTKPLTGTLASVAVSRSERILLSVSSQLESLLEPLGFDLVLRGNALSIIPNAHTVKALAGEGPTDRRLLHAMVAEAILEAVTKLRADDLRSVSVVVP